MQIFSGDEEVSLYDVTEQILGSDSVHEGNVSPPPYCVGRDDAVRDELLRQAAVAARWLHEQGYRGTASADFLLVYRDGEEMPEAYVCEINARVTGATYPSVLARHLRPEGAWLMRNLRLKEPLEGARMLELLEWPGHLYDLGNSFGVVPINFNFGSDGLVHKGQFLCLADTPEEGQKVLRAAESDLPIEWDYVRD